MTSLISLTLCGLCMLAAGSDDAYAFEWRWRDKDRKAEETRASSDDAPPETPSAPVTLTYIDTLNKGRELTLTEKDVKFIYAEPAPVQMTAAATPATASPAPEAAQPRPATTAPTASVTAVQPAPADAFRIQTLATSDIERARVEKKQLESRTRQPVYIMFEAPYYKIQVGDFSKRPAAEEFLADFRKSGYNDAWIVTVRADARSSR